MISDTSALKAAVDLLCVPTRARPMRISLLPGGIATLLEIASGDAEATSQGALLTGRSEETIRDAAVFFIEQILLAPDADSYRILGGTPELPTEELRRNMALLLRWLHPDTENSADVRANRSIYATRVTRAWDQLKTADRRATYEASRTADGTQRSPRHDGPTPHAKSTKSAKPGFSRDEAGRNARRGRPQGIWRAFALMFGARR
jgi:hypothetical protein